MNEFIELFNAYLGNTEGTFFFVIITFLGALLGWLFSKCKISWMVIALFAFAPIIDLLISVDHWTLTLPFVLGFLGVNARSLYKRVFEK